MFAFGRFEPRELLGGRLAPDRLVASGKATEALDDIAVQNGERVRLLAGCRELLHRQLLRLEALAVHQRHQQEMQHTAAVQSLAASAAASRCRLVCQSVCTERRAVGERRVEAALESPARHLLALRVGGERARSAAEHVARELVEQHAERDGGHGARVGPHVALAARRALVQREELRADRRVEFGRRAEPERAVRRREPELEHRVHLLLLGVRQIRSAVRRHLRAPVVKVRAFKGRAAPPKADVQNFNVMFV